MVSREFNLKSQLTVSLIIGFKESVSLIDRSVVVKELNFVPEIFSCRLLMICSHTADRDRARRILVLTIRNNKIVTFLP